MSVYPLQIRVYSLSGSHSRQPPSGATELRSNTPFPGGSLFLGTLYMVHTSCVSNTPLPGWGFRALRSAGTCRSRGGRKKGGTPTVSLPL